MDRSPVDKPLSLRADLLDPLVSLHWERCNDLPVRIASAHSVWLNNKLYVRGGVIHGGGSDARLLVYTPSEDSWELIPTPTQDYALATYHSHGQVVLVGDDPTTDEPTSKVWLLEGRSCVPHPTIPDMPVSTAFPCAVSSGDYLIVAGGDNGKGTAVSVFDGQKWCSAQALPERLYYLQSAVNGSEWFLSGEKKVYRASLKSLIASAVNPAAAQPAVWERLPDTPHRDSGITWCGGHLLAVGGQDQNENMRSVYAFDTQAKVWEHVSDLPGDGCYDSSCAVLPTGELLVAGGMGAKQRVLKATIRGKEPEAGDDIFDQEPEAGDIVSFKWMDSGTEQTFKLREAFSSTWRDLGRKFGFSGEKLHTFATNNRDNPEKCFDDVISHWMSDGSVPFEAYPVTWGGLVQALEDVGGVRVKVDKLKIALKKKKALPGKREHPEYSQSPSSTAATSSPPFTQAGSPKRSRAEARPTLRDYQNSLSEEAATATPSPSDVAHIATAMKDWKGLCYIMEFTDADQAAINDNNHTVEHKRTAVLDLWKRRRGKAATFAELVAIAYQASDLILVEKIIQVANQRSH